MANRKYSKKTTFEEDEETNIKQPINPTKQTQTKTYSKHKPFEKYLSSKKDSKNKDAVSELSLKIRERAEQLESENLKLVTEARKTLQKGKKTQKQTTSELKRQGEKLRSAKQKSKKTKSNVKKGEELADDIKREGNLIFTQKSWFQKFCDMFKKRSELDLNENENIATGDSENTESSMYYSEDEIEYKSEDETVKGEAKTNRELVEMSRLLKGMQKEARIQNVETNQQMGDIKEMRDVNKKTEKVIDRTNKKIDEL